MYDVGVVVAANGRDKEFILSLDEDATSKVIYEALLSKVDGASSNSTLVLERTGNPVGTDERVADLELRWGDRLTLVGGAAAPARAEGGWTLQGVGGPSAGTVIELTYGIHIVGRDPATADVVLTDQSISRPHARLEASDSAVVVTDLESTNGTYVDGSRLRAPVPVTSSQHVAFGDSDFQLIEKPVSAFGDLPIHIGWSQGTLSFNRQPRQPDPESSDKVSIPTPPSTPTKRKVPMISALVPLVGAGVIVLATHQPVYAVMAILSPMIIVFNALDDRRSGRKKFRQDAAKFRESLGRLGSELSDRLTVEKAWRERRWPSAVDLLALVTRLDSRLWWRRPMDDDFLDVRVGTSDQPVRFHVEYSSGGDAELNENAQALKDGCGNIDSAPAVVSLRELGVLGLVGSQEEVEAEARWLLAQITAEQSPRDVALAVIAPDRSAVWDCLKWAPHSRTLSEIDTPIALDDERASALWRGLGELIDRRSQLKSESFSVSAAPLPHVVVVVEPPLQIPRHTVTELLLKIGGNGLTVIWLAGARGELPGECDLVLEIPSGAETGSMWQTGAERTVQSVAAEGLNAAGLYSWLLELAPLRDITSQAGGGTVPRTVNLLTLLGLEDIDGRGLTRRWASDDKALRCVVGHDGESVFSLDIERDGPHGLVAGMTGSGKSEFLQGLVSSLACSYPPSRINFVLIDYKGGSAFQSCRYLPHTVGFVTDLDGHLAERAMISLDAELAYREHVITVDGGAKDLAELRRRSPNSAPPSLLIVVDEFAFLKKEVPEFVDRLVDVAQRGRSLGVHLILATQRPRNVVNDDIRGNANLRVALRVASSEDSKEVIDRADAVAIAKDLPGRAYIKTEHSSVRAVQSAYVGGDSRAPEATGVALAQTFVGTGTRAEQRALALAMRNGSEDVTDLDRIVVAAQEAFAANLAPSPRKPWVDPLSALVALDSLAAVVELGSLAVSVGQADIPAKQCQESYVIDLDATPNFLVYGGPGKGKTTFLRTLTVALAAKFGTEEVNFYAIDFGQNGLSELAGLPHWGGAAGQGDLAKVHRLIDLLEELLAERRDLLSESRTASAREYRKVTSSSMAEIVVLIDNLSAVSSLMNTMAEQAYLTRLYRLVADGRSAGLHFVITVDRSGAVPAALASVVAGSLVLSLSNPMDYASLGLARLNGLGDQPPGRSFDRTGTEVQVAMVGDSEGGTPGDQLRSVVTRIAASVASSDLVIPLRLLPLSVEFSSLPVSCSLRDLVIGIDERYQVAKIDLVREPHFLVVGPSGSGRSTALQTLVGAIRSVEPSAASFLFAPRRSALTDMGGWTSLGTNPETMLQTLGELREALSARGGDLDHLIVVVVDDGDDLAESSSPLSGPLDQIQRAASDSGVIFLAAVSAFKALRTYSSWIGPLRSAKNGLLLWPDSQTADVFESRLPNAHGGDVPAGRAQLFMARGSRSVQVAT